MKHILSGLMTAGLLLAVPAAYAQDSTTKDGTVIDNRQDRQDKRIKAGVKDGSLTKGEAAKLKAQDRQVDRQIKRAEKDGEVTNKEKAKITREQNQNSKNIAKQRNDKQNRK
jgi:hypothetical protein